MFGLTRKNAAGKTRPGPTAYAIAAVTVFCVLFFILSKRSGMTKPSSSRERIVSDTRKMNDGIASWQGVKVAPGLVQEQGKEQVNARLSTAQPDVRPPQSVLDAQGLNLSRNLTENIQEVDVVQEDMGSALGSLLRNSKLTETATGSFGVRLETADDGSSVLRARSGVFTAFAEPGTRLVGPDGIPYVIAEDGMLYAEQVGGRREKVTTYVRGFFKDLEARLYVIDKDSKQLRLHTPGPPGLFRGPDSRSYRVNERGEFEVVDSEGNTTSVSRIEGSGEFLGTDKQVYVLVNGLLFGKRKQTTSFAAQALQGSGYFRGPDGRVYLRGNDGKLYTADKNQNWVLSNMGGEGSFVGPDGSLYRTDGAGGAVVVKNVQTTPVQQSVGYSPAKTARKVGLSAEVQIDENMVNFATADKQGLPDGAVDKLKGGYVYARDLSKEREERQQAEKAAAQKNKRAPKPFPLGQRIPFYLLSTVNTSVAEPGLIEAVVAENVFFHDIYLPAGTRIYGRMGAINDNHRVTLSFGTFVFTDGTELAFSGQVFDSNMVPGIEAYYSPTPPWIYGLRYSNVALVYELQKRQPVDREGKPVGDLTKVVELLTDTQKEIEGRNKGFHTLRAGSQGIIMLTAPLDMSRRRIAGSLVSPVPMASSVKTTAEIEKEQSAAAGAISMLKPVADSQESEPQAPMQLNQPPELQAAISALEATNGLSPDEQLKKASELFNNK